MSLSFMLCDDGGAGGAGQKRGHADAAGGGRSDGEGGAGGHKKSSAGGRGARGDDGPGGAGDHHHHGGGGGGGGGHGRRRLVPLRGELEEEVSRALGDRCKEEVLGKDRAGRRYLLLPWDPSRVWVHAHDASDPTPPAGGGGGGGGRLVGSYSTCEDLDRLIQGLGPAGQGGAEGKLKRTLMERYELVAAAMRRAEALAAPARRAGGREDWAAHVDAHLFTRARAFLEERERAAGRRTSAAELAAADASALDRLRAELLAVGRAKGFAPPADGAPAGGGPAAAAAAAWARAVHEARTPADLHACLSHLAEAIADGGGGGGDGAAAAAAAAAAAGRRTTLSAVACRLYALDAALQYDGTRAGGGGGGGPRRGGGGDAGGAGAS